MDEDGEAVDKEEAQDSSIEFDDRFDARPSQGDTHRKPKNANNVKNFRPIDGTHSGFLKLEDREETFPESKGKVLAEKEIFRED